MKTGRLLLTVSCCVLIIFLLSGCKCEHEWQDADCVTPKTCVKCSETEGESLGHDWQAADCTTPKTCSICGATEGEALGHQWQEAGCLTPKTCAVCGATEGEPRGHLWQEAGCETPKTCTDCGLTEGEPLGHDPDYACEEDTECIRCGTTIKASGHIWSDKIKNVAATCTKGGYDKKTCTICGDTKKINKTDALGHSYSNGVCVRCGEAEPKGVCERCGKSVPKSSLRSATFINDEYEGTHATQILCPDCYSNEYLMVFQCSRCGEWVLSYEFDVTRGMCFGCLNG